MTLNTTTAATLLADDDRDLVEAHIAHLEAEPFTDEEIAAAFGEFHDI